VRVSTFCYATSMHPLISSALSLLHRPSPYPGSFDLISLLPISSLPYSFHHLTNFGLEDLTPQLRALQTTTSPRLLRAPHLFTSPRSLSYRSTHGKKKDKPKGCRIPYCAIYIATPKRLSLQFSSVEHRVMNEEIHPSTHPLLPKSNAENNKQRYNTPQARCHPPPSRLNQKGKKRRVHCC